MSLFWGYLLEETIDTVVNPLRNRITLRVWEGNNTGAIIKLMLGAEHEFSVRRLLQTTKYDCNWYTMNCS